MIFYSAFVLRGFERTTTKCTRIATTTPVNVLRFTFTFFILRVLNTDNYKFFLVSFYLFISFLLFHFLFLLRHFITFLCDSFRKSYNDGQRHSTRRIRGPKYFESSMPVGVAQCPVPPSASVPNPKVAGNSASLLDNDFGFNDIFEI